MTSSMAGYNSAVEARVLDELRPRYECRGYRFVVHPDRSSLPAFMQGYVPDAVALNDRENIAIEVKGASSSRLTDSVEKIRRLFIGHDDWKFTVVYGGESQHDVAIPLADHSAIKREIVDVDYLANNGHSNAALIMAFALLEAIAHIASGAGDRRPRRPDTVVQTLAMNGLVDAEQESRLRRLADVRNRIVHGDLSLVTSSADAQWLVETIRQLADASGAPG